MPLSEDEFADLVAQVAGIPYEVEALPRKHGLAARGLAVSDRLEEDLGIDDEMRTELAVAAAELLGEDASGDIRRAVESARTVGDLWRVLGGPESAHWRSPSGRPRIAPARAASTPGSSPPRVRCSAGAAVRVSCSRGRRRESSSPTAT